MYASVSRGINFGEVEEGTKVRLQKRETFL